VRRATKETAAGRRYLDLQRQARRTGRRTDELIQLYALECFLDRLAHSDFAEQFVLKGGVLLAALDARRPTRDIDFAARAVDNSIEQVSAVVRRIAGISLDDGVEFDSDNATAVPRLMQSCERQFTTRRGAGFAKDHDTRRRANDAVDAV